MNRASSLRRYVNRPRGKDIQAVIAWVSDCCHRLKGPKTLSKAPSTRLYPLYVVPTGYACKDTFPEAHADYQQGSQGQQDSLDCFTREGGRVKPSQERDGSKLIFADYKYVSWLTQKMHYSRMQERYIEEADIPPCPNEDGSLLKIGGGQTEMFYCFLENEVSFISVLSFWRCAFQ